MGEQVAGGQGRGGGRVAQPEAGQVVAHGTVEIQHTVVDQLLDERSDSAPVNTSP
ncbi:hypothetical protein AB0L44_37855 [Nonomuraea wenchangensis]|uniref:hypothetical protein n=1 Tax=Nonomuraea wenchangensis TaxID=568860 RepID=UPI0034300096